LKVKFQKHEYKIKIPKTRIQNKKFQKYEYKIRYQKHEYKVKYKNTNTKESPKIRIQYEKSNLKTNISEINKQKTMKYFTRVGGNTL